LIKLLNHHDEVFALMMYFIERHYLKNWSTSTTSSPPFDFAYDLRLISSVNPFLMTLKADLSPKTSMACQEKGGAVLSRSAYPAFRLAPRIILLGD
jgi:hypothetical protein